MKTAWLCLALALSGTAFAADGIWSPLGSGVSIGSFAVATMNGTVYTGGSFTNAGGSPINYLAQWNGSNWSVIGPGINDWVWALLATNGIIYAGGTSSNEGSPYVGQWNGTNWTNLASSFYGGDAGVDAMAIAGSNLYVGGAFDQISNQQVPNIELVQNVVEWNGTSWSPLGTYQGEGGGVFTANTGGPFQFQAYFPVEALAVSGTNLYVGGEFDAAGSYVYGHYVMASNIAQWNGTSWSALGSGVNNTVFALAVSGNILYAGGAFTQAGGIPANYIAQWDGTNWSPLGSGLSGKSSSPYWDGPLAPYVGCMAVSGGMLYVGGGFIYAGSVLANNITRWDGTNWSAIGSGLNGYSYCLTVSGNWLYAGGFFTEAGGNPADCFAVANLAPVSILSGNSAFGFINGSFGFDITGPSGSNVTIQGSRDLETWTALQTNQFSNGLFYYSDSQSPTNSQRYYRALLGP